MGKKWVHWMDFDETHKFLMEEVKKNGCEKEIARLEEIYNTIERYSCHGRDSTGRFRSPCDTCEEDYRKYRKLADELLRKRVEQQLEKWTDLFERGKILDRDK